MPQKPHQFSVRVYYEDTDFSGVVYHASYLRFLERGRTEFLRALGVEHRILFEQGESFHFAVRAMTLDFRKPALMDDQLIVETGLETLGGASITMRQSVLRGIETLISANVRIAVLSGGRAIRIPAALRETLAGAGGR